MTLKHRTTLTADLDLIHVIQTESAEEAAAAMAAIDMLSALDTAQKAFVFCGIQAWNSVAVGQVFAAIEKARQHAPALQPTEGDEV